MNVWFKRRLIYVLFKQHQSGAKGDLGVEVVTAAGFMYTGTRVLPGLSMERGHLALHVMSQLVFLIRFQSLELGPEP